MSSHHHALCVIFHQLEKIFQKCKSYFLKNTAKGRKERRKAYGHGKTNIYWAPTVYQTLDVVCAFWLTLYDEPMGLGLLTLHPNKETGALRSLRTLWESRSNLPRDGAGVTTDFFKINEEEEGRERE